MSPNCPFVWRFVAVILASILCTSPLVANPVITEFMADNTGTISDEDGDYSDWIEVHNPTSAPIDLLGWSLKDSADTWVFPAVTLEPGEFLVVWASNKNRRTPGQPLHTNFALSKDGEYLALVRPNGTVQQEFAPAYPPLDKNESYGLQFTSTTFIAQGATARYHIPANDSLGTSWISPGFNHNTWASGPTGMGYGLLVPGIKIRHVAKNPSFGRVNSVATATGLLAQPSGSPQIAADATIVAPTVNILGDGGDGHYGGNIPPPNGVTENYVIHATGWIHIPTAGVYTFGLNSDDGGRIRIDGADVMVDDSNHGPADHVGSVNLTAGLHSFDVIMWEDGGGDEVEFYAAPGNFSGWTSEMRLVGDTASGGLAAFTLPSGAGSSVIANDIESAMRNVNATAYFRIPFNASGPGTFTSLSLKMRYNDGYVAYLNGTKIAERNAPALPAFNSSATVTRPDADALVTEPVNVTSFLPQLNAGSNVLAVHGLNNAASDDSFLILPELVGGSLNTEADPVFFDITKATPGAINGAFSILGKVAEPQFTMQRGFYTSPISVGISTATPGATIRYTTNGSEPTESTGTIYTAPININSTRVLRVAAFKPGFQPSAVVTQTYLFLNDVIAQSPTGAPPPGWPASSGTSQVMDYGMDPDIVNNPNPDIGGASEVKKALTAIPTISMVIDLPDFLNINGSQGMYSNPGGRGFGWERKCSLELILPPDDTSPVGHSEFQVNCGVRIRGGFSRSTDNPKHSFHYYFRGEYGAGKLNYPLFGREGASQFDQIDLRTSQNYSWAFGGDSNNTFLREESSRILQRDMGQPYSRLRYFHLYINGHYWGLFNTEERTEASFAESYFGGSKEEYDVVKCEQTANYTVGATDGDLNAWQDLWNKARTHAANPTNANYFRMMGLAADGVTPTADPVLLDPDNLIDYMLATFWTANADGATSQFLGNDRANNWFGIRRRNGSRGFMFFAHDFEHSFGLQTGGPSGDRTGPFISPNQADFAYSNPMFLHQDLMGNLEYRMRFADRTHRHMFNKGALTAEAWTTRLNSLAAIVESAIVAESARWGDAKTHPPLNRLHWRNARDYLLNTYVPARGPYVISQLRADGLYPTIDAPTMVPFGGYVPSGTEVVMSAPSGGTIYYMPDGSDPRAVGGSIRPGAQVYTSSTSTDILIPLGAVWRYLDNGSDQGTAWRHPGFDDSSWKSGPAELGYGDGDEATVVEDNPVPGYSSASDRFATTYFRKTFDVENVNGITGLTLTVKYDDAVAVYINGQLVQRPGLPENPAYNHYTNSAIEDTTAQFSIDPSVLVEGVNTIAAEVHQSGPTSTDLSFNLSLVATRSSTATPFFITGDGVRPLRVRAYDSGSSTWSALTDATFIIDAVPASTANLAISEIMYHPADPSSEEIAAGFTNPEAFEYLELVNYGQERIDLAGLYFYGSIGFNFPTTEEQRYLEPGGRVLLVADRDAFEFRYGTGLPILGEYSGQLSNSGERLILYAESGAVIRSFLYDDGGEWPGEADGDGYSLVMRKPGALEEDNLPLSWRASVTVGGNPGASDALSYTAWKLANDVSDDMGDDDGDGLSNVLEYVFGGDLAVSDSTRLPRVELTPFNVQGVTQEFVAIEIRRPFGADDATFVVESANDPAGPWTTSATTLVGIQRESDGMEVLTFRSTLPFKNGARGFYRAKVVIQP